ncbi:hypothetical protein Tco_1560807 [Tanacetum coccineum]
MAETMEQYMSKTRADYGSGVSRPKIKDKYHFELKGQFLKELRENTFNGSNHEDANEHIEKVLEIVDLFHVPNITQDQLMLRVFPIALTGAASHWLRNEPTVLEDMDAYRDEGMSDVIFSEPFLREVGIIAKRFEGMITIYNGNEEVTYQMISEEDKMNGISHSYQKLKGFYKGVWNLGPDYIRDAKME